LENLVVLDGKVAAQPLHDDRRLLGNILVRSPNPMTTRWLNVVSLASLSNARELGLIRPEQDGTYHCRQIEGENNMTDFDDLVIANVLLFHVYGAVKTWHYYRIFFMKEDPTTDGPLYRLLGLWDKELDQFESFFRVLSGGNNSKRSLVCLATLQHRVPDICYATAKGGYNFIWDAVMTFPAKVRQIVADPTIKHPHMVVEAIDHHLKSCTNGMDMWAFIAQGMFADLTHVFQFVTTESHCNTNNVKVSHSSKGNSDSNGEDSLWTGVKLSEDQWHTTTNDDPNITSYHPAHVVLGVGATEALNYACAIMGYPYLTLETLYLVWLKHLRSCTELELCLL
jgi:hypothetical protein